MPYFIGCNQGKMELFKSKTVPTEETHGHLYKATIGPFKTKRGAIFMLNNPGVASVSEAEKLGRITGENNGKTTLGQGIDKKTC